MINIQKIDVSRRRYIHMFPNKKIQSLIGSHIQVEMKGDKHILEGKLESADEYLNLHLTDTNEMSDGVKSRSLGSVVLRGNNIILVKEGK